MCLWKPEQTSPVHVFDNEFRCPLNTIQWSQNYQNSNVLLAAGGQDGFIAIWNVNIQQVWQKLHAHDSQQGGVRCVAFSPNNKMIASGGLDNLVIWSLTDNCQVVKHYQRGAASAAKPGEPTPAGGGADVRACVSEVNWSHDGILLSAAIHDYIAVFDVRKFGKPVLTVPQASSSSAKPNLLRPSGSSA